MAEVCYPDTVNATVVCCVLFALIAAGILYCTFADDKDQHR